MLNQLAMLFLILGVCTALMIVKDLIRQPQPVTIMNIVWPLTGLYMPFLGWLAWWFLGRNPLSQRASLLIQRPAGRHQLWRNIFLTTSLCAAACVLGDSAAVSLALISQKLAYVTPLWVDWGLSLTLSLVIGLLLQFLAIRQRRQIGFFAALLLAMKTQTFPLVIYQIGIFITMSLALKFVLHGQINPLLMQFWFMLQLAMMMGFIFSWPASNFLIKRGIRAAI